VGSVPFPVVLASVFVVVAALSGCGHPATREECSRILDKSAELKLREQNVDDPALIESRVEAFRQAKGQELLDRCIGRNVTKSAIECVERADSASAVDRCLY
jgi:hypothetical protein